MAWRGTPPAWVSWVGLAFTHRINKREYSPMNSVLVWRIIGRDNVYDIETLQEERNRFLDLHYDRFTYYPFHDKARIDRDFIHRSFLPSFKSERLC